MAAQLLLLNTSDCIKNVFCSLFYVANFDQKVKEFFWE